MKATESTLLTQKQLLSALKRIGFCETSERQLQEWRRKGLLPPFDDQGRGVGRGRGRTESAWRNRRQIVKQAVWVCRLFEIYNNVSELYFPLWVLGFPIHIEPVKKTLTEPLENITAEINKNVSRLRSFFDDSDRRDRIIEDYVDDIASNLAGRLDYFPQIPIEAVEAPLNIFLNSDYPIDEGEFVYGMSQYNGWKDRLNGEVIPRLLDGVGTEADETVTPIRPDAIDLIYENAAFFQNYLSVPVLRRVLAEADEMDFLNVQEDMRVVRFITESLGKVLSIVLKSINEFSRSDINQVLLSLMELTKIIVLVDLSARRHGFSERLDAARGNIVEKVRNDFASISRADLAEASPEIAKSFGEGLKTLRKNFRNYLKRQSAAVV
jgi:hypothetical protein